MSYSLGLRSDTKARTAGQHDILRQSWKQAPHAGCVQVGPKPETHPDIRVMWPKSVLQRLRTRMGVPRGLMPSATFEDTFTSAASCRRPTRGLQDPQNEHGLPPRPYPSPYPVHTHSILGPLDGRVLVPKHLHGLLPHLRQ